jgi:hypothetical protein
VYCFKTIFSHKVAKQLKLKMSFLSLSENTFIFSKNSPQVETAKFRAILSSEKFIERTSN